MIFNQVKKAIYALFLTNKFGFKLRRTPDAEGKSRLRLEYAETLMSSLNISVELEGEEKLDKGGQYLVISNHRDRKSVV